MSSSVFIESSSQVADTASTSDSNLVVVYGKNGISFDDKGLENLIGMVFYLILIKSIYLSYDFYRGKENFINKCNTFDFAHSKYAR